MTPPPIPGACTSTATSIGRSPWRAHFQPESDQHPARLRWARRSTRRAATHGFFNGALDEVRVWNVARTRSQIQAARDRELTSGTGLIARYGLNEGTGTTASSSVAGRAQRHAHQRPGVDDAALRSRRHHRRPPHRPG